MLSTTSNMDKRVRYNRVCLRFRRWCRKAYAAFCSLGKCVTIGCLSKSIADASLRKQSLVFVPHVASGNVRLQSLEVGDGSGWPEEEQTRLREGGLCLWATCLAWNKQTVDQHDHSYFTFYVYKTKRRLNGYVSIRSAFFVSRTF